MIYFLRSRATQEQLTATLEELTEYVKPAVDMRASLAEQAGAWSEKILQRSGLLNL